MKNFNDQLKKSRETNTPVKTPNSLTIKPDINAPYSLYRFDGVLFETNPHPGSLASKDNIISNRDKEIQMKKIPNILLKNFVIKFVCLLILSNLTIFVKPVWFSIIWFLEYWYCLVTQNENNDTYAYKNIIPHKPIKTV